MTKPEIIAELTALEVKFDEKANAKDLAKLLKDAKSKENGNGENTQAKNTSKGEFIIWLKNRTYISDDKRVEAGLYLVDEVPARFSKLNADAVEVFESEVPSRKLATIARWAGLNPDGVEDEEILEKLLSTEFKPF
jgi:hypothetical protein